MSTEFRTYLRRWLSGDFRRADEAEVRRRAAADPFEREAFEGYWTAPGYDHESRLDSISRTLREKHPDHFRPTVAPPGIRPVRWMAAAASVAVLLGAFWFFSKKMDDGGAVTDAAAPEAERMEQPPVASAPTVEPASDAALNEEPADSKATGPAAASRAARRSEQPEPTALPPAADYAVPVPATEPKQQTPTPEPIGNGGIQPTAGTSTLAAKKQQSAESADAAKSKEEAVFNTDRVLRAQPAAAPPSEDTEQPRPAEGWDQYRAYLRTNARLTPQARDNNITGTVRLRVTFSPEGEPATVMLVKSLGYGCDEEAIRLVREGGIWLLGTKNQVVELDVPFRR